MLYDEYNEVFYNQICHDISVLMTNDLPENLYSASKYCKMLRFDDVYVGMVGHLLGTKFESFDGYIIDKNQLAWNKKFLFIEELHDDYELLNIWDIIVKSNIK